MTVKSLRRQLIAAIAMVVVSAVALSSSTYAWFVGNNTVTANGLSIKAQSEAGILISHKHDNSSDNVWASSASGVYTSAQALYPTSTANGTNWYHASAATLSESTAAEGSMEKLNITETASATGEDGKIGGVSDKNYYIVDSFDIYTTGTSADNLRLKDVVISNANSTVSFDSSIRLLVVCGENKYVVAPVAGATRSYTVGANADKNNSAGTSVTAYTITDMAATTGTTHYLADSVSADKTTPTNVKIYMYFEGEDENHYTNNFTNTKDYSVTLTFEADVTK